MPRRSIPRSTEATGGLIDMKTGRPAERPVIPILCERIRHFRTLARLEQKELASRIGISSNAVSNWENGRGRPDINLLPSLCEALNVSIYDLLAMEDPSPRYSSVEQALISQYRNLSPGHKIAVDQLMDTLLRIQEAENAPQLRRLIYYSKSLSAGFGDPSEFDDEGEPIFLYASRETERSDCVFPVNGDSMEPDFHDGDRVLVARIPNAPDLKHGEIGAFIYGNETYIKIYEEDGLHSLNPRYKPLHFSDSENVYLIGRVTGVLAPSQIATDEDREKYLLLHPEETRTDK